MSSSSARTRQISELEAENARLHKEAKDLTNYLLELRSALSGRSAANPRWDESPRGAR
jgi:hypothetical protein